MRCVAAWSVALLWVVGTASALDNNLGKTPPLGWSSWNYFANHINESVILEMADAMVSTGLAKVGYEYINIDAGYLTRPRDASQRLRVNSQKFPSGIKHLADKIHAKGLKLGVYTDLGVGSCGTGPGSGGHYQLDADTFASWTVDYLKVDYCSRSVSHAPAPQYAAFAALRDALNKTGREIYYSICPHAVAPEVGTGAPYHNASVYSPPSEWTSKQRHELANSLLVEYTNTFDLWYADPVPRGDGGPMSEPGGLITNIDSVVQMTKLGYSVAGSWNDADMLQICTFGEGATRHWNSTGLPGNDKGTGMTLREYTSHLAVWAVLGSPLIHSADLRTLKDRHPECLELMLNPEILAVNQDPDARPAELLWAKTNVTGKDYTQVNSTAITQQAFARPLSGGRVAVVLFNRDDGPANASMVVNLTSIGFPAAGKGASVPVRDVVARQARGTAPRGGSWSALVPAHGVAFVVFG